MTEIQQDLLVKIAGMIDVNDSQGVFLSLLQHYFDKGDFDRWFEVRKCQIRQELGLPLSGSYASGPEGEKRRADMESRLEQIALECGQYWAKAGEPMRAWTYLRAVENQQAVRAALEAIVVNDDNANELIEIGLHHRAHPRLAMEIATVRLGTCSSITILDSSAGFLAREELNAASEVLVSHLYREISSNAAKRLGLPEGTQLEKMLQTHQPALAQSSPHVDPSHLCSVLRLGRFVNSNDCLRMLVAMAGYAGLLPESMQYPGDVPFTDIGTSHRVWYEAMIGDTEKIGAAREYFLDLVRHSGLQERVVALEHLVWLLWKRGAADEAAKIATMEIGVESEDERPWAYGDAGIGPHLMELARHDSSRELVARYFLDRNDALGYALARLSR